MFTRLGVTIEPDVPSILNLIHEYPITVVKSANGTGESVAIPVGVARDRNRILVVVPNRKTAVSLYHDMIRRLKKTNLKIGVGYAISGDVRVDDNTNIIYATANYVYRKMLALFTDGVLDFVGNLADIIMVTEYDSGNSDSDMIFLLWKQGALSGTIIMPRILLSGSSYIDLKINPDSVGRYEAKKVSTYTTDLQYASKNYNAYDKSLLNDTADLVINLYNTTTGNFMICTSGPREVNSIAKRIQKNIHSDGVTILRAYGVMTQDRLDKINSPAKSGIRKIIITSNLIEPILTIRDLSVVVDTMIEKRQIKTRGGGSKLVSKLIDKNTANQRRFRAGRTQDGACYRMITEEQYRKLHSVKPREIKFIPLHNQVIDLFGAGFSPSSILDIPSVKYDKIIRRLKNLGLLDRRDIPTDASRFVASLPLGLEAGIMIWKWLQTKSDIPVLPCVIIATMIDRRSNSYFTNFELNETRLPGDRQRRIRGSVVKSKHGDFIGYSDIHTYFKIWKGLTDYTGGMNGSYKEVRDWSIANAINYEQINDVYNTVQRIMRKLSSMYNQRTALVARIASVRKATNHIATIIEDVYANSRMTRVKNFNYRDNWGTIYTLERIYNRNMLTMEPPDIVYTILSKKIKTNSVITCAYANKPRDQRQTIPAYDINILTNIGRKDLNEAVIEDLDKVSLLDSIVSTVKE